MLALILLPTSHGIAFDAVQKRLRDFHTLTLQIEQQAQGLAMPSIRVQMNRAGHVRTDLGTSVIVNRQEHRTLTLLHDSRQALQMPLPAHAGAPDPLAWLEPARLFQGEAHKLPGIRFIDGKPTTGWVLDVQGMHIPIRADADAVPRAGEMGGHGHQLHQSMHLAIDTPIDPAVFGTTLPAGYHLMQADSD